MKIFEVNKASHYMFIVSCAIISDMITIGIKHKGAINIVMYMPASSDILAANTNTYFPGEPITQKNSSPTFPSSELVTRFQTFRS